ncbi:Sec-independent protein translocase protein TatB [Acinetobacter beijerinckii]|uniref:Sec-independent protein translocase protein TatB n=1 Tax=Acinetobacter beijerinckii TaxID=262668 RepID=UPI0024056305|nr:Sec-independent protein translocase protein TatB [Acinetobacter beijerinckii]
MLNLGMTEIFCFAVIALLVLGPDKLPEAARFVAKWYGKIKKFINNIQNEIDRELKLSEFRDEMQKEIEKITELERRLQKQLDELKTQPAEEISPEQTLKYSLTKNNYIPYVSGSIIPFSIQHHKSFPSLIESNLSTEKFDTELKIAV